MLGNGKGISVLVGTILIVLVAVAVLGSVVYWMRSTSERVQRETEEQVESKAEKVSFYINDTEVLGSEVRITIVNNGKFPINSDEISVYYQGELKTATKVSGPDSIKPGQSAVFNITR